MFADDMTLYIEYPNNANNKLLQCTSDVGKVAVVQSLGHVRLCDPTDCSMSDSSVLHCPPEFAQIHVCWVGDAI